MSAIVFDSSDEARKMDEFVTSFKTSLGWQLKSELKFRKTNKQIVKDLLFNMSRYVFHIYAVYVDKEKLKNFSKIINSKKLYTEIISELLALIPLSDDVKIKIDGISNGDYNKRTATYFRKNLNRARDKSISISFEDSVKNNLLQVADLISGSINRSMQTRKTDSQEYMNIIKAHIVKNQEIADFETKRNQP